jgi:hypothetical protein
MKMQKGIIIGVIVAVVIVCVALFFGLGPTFPVKDEKPGEIKIVSASWLNSHLGDKNLVIIDAQPTIWIILEAIYREQFISTKTFSEFIRT